MAHSRFKAQQLPHSVMQRLNWLMPRSCRKVQQRSALRNAMIMPHPCRTQNTVSYIRRCSTPARKNKKAALSDAIELVDAAFLPETNNAGLHLALQLNWIITHCRKEQRHFAHSCTCRYLVIAGEKQARLALGSGAI